MTKRNRFTSRWLLLLILFLFALAIWQQQAIKDWFRLYGYEPPTAIVTMADDIALTDDARHLLYVNKPEIQDRAAFQSSCSNKGEHTIVLGCYHPVDRGIYVFHVSDERLAGVNQVTMAHEVLHAAYDRLKPSERQRIDRLLQEYYGNELRDDRIKSIIATYTKSEPDDVVNEMHSIFATEITQLPDELEKYYRAYFSDRSKVLTYAGRYQAEFTSRQQQVADHDKRLGVLKQQIKTSTEQLETYESQVTALKNRMDTDRAQDNVDAYNASVPVYNRLIGTYNSLVVDTKSKIAQYNALVNERNQVALQVSELAKSIDSSPQAIN